MQAASSCRWHAACLPWAGNMQGDIVRPWTAILLAGIAMPLAAANVHPLADLERRAEASVRAQYADNADVEVSAVPLDRRLRLARCENLQAEPQRAAGGVVSVRLRCSEGNGWSIYTQVRVREFRKVLVLERALAAGEAVKAADVRHERRDVAQLAGGYLESLQELAGVVAARPLAPQTVLTPRLFEPPVLVERNQQVKLVVVIGEARIEGSGIALQPGAIGELVRVRNDSSGRVVQGRVTAAGEIHVGG